MVREKPLLYDLLLVVGSLNELDAWGGRIVLEMIDLSSGFVGAASTDALDQQLVGNFDENHAVELEAAIAVNPFNAGWHFNLALTFEAMENYAGAAAAYAQAVEIEPADVETLNGLGVNLTRLDKHEEALKHLERIEELDPSFEPGYCNRIIAYTELGRHEEAELMFYTARLFKDECPLCYYNIATSLYARKLYEQAIACWRRVLEIGRAHV